MATPDSMPATAAGDVNAPTITAVPARPAETALPETAVPPGQGTDAASEQTVVSGAGTHDPNVTLVADTRARRAQKGTQTFQVQVGAPRPFAPDEQGSDLARYELGEDVARGGLGKIRKAVDKRIQREVAFKELLPKGLSEPAYIERFLDEAQITGQLEHPGIVPIYDLGWQDNGTPFYAMKFVRGLTFRAAIESLHGLPADSPERKLRFAKHLRSFVDICQAIAFAHHRGVLHRDLKPHNVMLGEFGETLVLDWGLAKVFSQEAFEQTEETAEPATDGTNALPSTPTRGEKSEAEEGTVLQRPVNDEATLIQEPQAQPEDSNSSPTEFMGRSGTGSETAAISGTATPSRHGKTRRLRHSVATNVRTDASKTQAGSIMGTPSYMPPEQARGEGNLDERADIYSLGAILYELLTGKPPIAKGPDMLKRILESQIPLPRSINRTVPPALEAVAMKALAGRREDRYATALELASDVERFMADEPTSVYREPWQVRLRRWTRKHRTLVTSTGVSIVLLLAGAAGWSVWETRRLAGLQGRVRKGLDSAQRALANDDLPSARSALGAIEGVVHSEPTLASFNGEIQLATGAIERREVEREKERLTAVKHQAHADLEAARVDLEDRKDLPAAARRLTEVVTVLRPEEALGELRSHAQAKLAEVERAMARARAENTEAERYAQFEHLLEEARFLTANLRDVGRRPAMDSAWKARRLYHVERGQPLQIPEALAPEKAARLPGQVQELLLLSAVGALSLTGGERAAGGREALDYLHHANELAREQALPPSDVVTNLLISTYNELGRAAEGDALQKTMRSIEPRTAADWVILAQQQQNYGLYPQAFFFYQQALNLEPDHFLALYSLGSCNLQQLAALGPSAEDDQEVAGYLSAASTAFTGCLALRPEFPWAFMMRAVANHSLQRHAEAHQDFDRALRLKDSPQVYDREAFLFALHMNRGAAYFKEERLEDAAKEFAAAETVRPQAAEPLTGRARILARREQFPEALTQLETAVRREPMSAYAHRLMADVLVSLHARQPEAYPDSRAVAAVQKTLELEIIPASRANDLYDLGRIHLRAKRWPEALQAFDDSLNLNASHADAHRLRGETLLELKRLPEAIEALSEYLKRARQPQADAYRARGLAHAALGKYREATQDYARALELDPKSANIRTRMGWAFLLKNYQLAEQDFDAAIQENPDNGDSWNGRGFARVKQGRHAEGVADAEEAAKRGPDTWPTYFNAAGVYAQALLGLARDKQLTPDERKALGDRYTARAIELLKRAATLASPAEFKANLEGDEALEPLRDQAEFQKLKE